MEQLLFNFMYEPSFGDLVLVDNGPQPSGLHFIIGETELQFKLNKFGWVPKDKVRLNDPLNPKGH